MAKYLYQILLISTLCLFLQNTSAQESTTGFENGNNQYVMRESNLSDMSKDKKIKPVTFGVEAGASIDMSGNDFFRFRFIRRLPVPHHQMLWFRNRSSQFIFQQSILPPYLCTFPL